MAAGLTSVVITTTNAAAQTWTVPTDCPVGTSLKIEAWGAGSGGSGSSTSFRAGGAGGAYATAPAYFITPNDVASGISYTLKTGTAGTGAANATVGPDTSWSTNNLNTIPTSILSGVVIGTPGTMPTESRVVSLGTLVSEIVAFGYTAGFPYIDIHFSGTTSTTSVAVVLADNGNTLAPVTPAAYINSMYLAVVGGSLSNILSTSLASDCSTSLHAYITTTGANITAPTSTLTRASATYTFPATSAFANAQVSLNFNSGVAIDVTLRVAAPQLELGSSTSFWKSTPGYTLAKGGGAPSGTTGGVGGATASCIPTTGAFAGGSGATRTQGGGGGGSAGKDGAGASSTTGTGGTGDNALGGTAGVSNVEGGGGATAGTAPTAGGDPGAGGAGNTSTGNGSAGGRGQIRVTYSPSVELNLPSRGIFVLA